MHRLAPCVLLFVGLSACSEDITTTPTTTTSVTITEGFEGTLTRNGAATHPFTSGPGTVSATLTTISPDSAILVGLGLGTWNGSTCQIVLANDKATQATVIIGNASSTSNFCVRIYDVGLVVGPETYKIDVVHF